MEQLVFLNPGERVWNRSLLEAEAARGERLTSAMARMQAKREAAQIERRILAGENHFTVAAPAGSHVGVYVYDVPTWRREPIKRLRVEWVSA